MNFRLAVTLLLLFTVFHKVQAATPDAVTIHFRANITEIDSTYAENGSALVTIDSIAGRLASDTLIVPEALYISGYSSPEGPEDRNRHLAEERRMAVQSLVLSRYPELSGIVAGDCEAIDWQKIINILSQSEIPGKERFIRILNRASANGGYVSAPWLASVDGGSLWRIVEPVLAGFRYAEVRPRFTIRPVVGEDGTKDVEFSYAAYAGSDSVLAEEIIVTELAAATVEPPKPFYMSVRTNMLYDAVAIPTLGAEFYLGRNISIGGQWSYAWWHRNARHRYWRFYGGDIGARWWFGSGAHIKPLTGHHLGIYAQIFTYDFEFGGKGQMSHKFNYGGGVEYGFSLPVARRLNIDFTIGIGYIGGEYYKYVPVDGHYVWQSTHRRNWFGPTKAEISLVWLIGRGNVNLGKGGDR